MKLNELFGTEFPLIQGGMASIATGEFAAAVSNAGALGLVGAGGMNAAQLRDHIRRCKELTDRPFGVNLMLMNPEVEEQAKIVRDIFRWYLDGASVLGVIKKLSDAGIPSPTGKEKWNKRMIETMLKNQKYTGTVTLLDSATQEYQYQMKECISPIITESEFRAVQEEKAKRSNIVTDNDGTHRSSKKYSSKKKN